MLRFLIRLLLKEIEKKKNSKNTQKKLKSWSHLSQDKKINTKKNILGNTATLF